MSKSYREHLIKAYGLVKAEAILDAVNWGGTLPRKKKQEEKTVENPRKINKSPIKSSI